MDKATYFISDLHLEAHREDITCAFLHFLQNIKSDAEKLYILGDFFNVWIGDDAHSKLSQCVSSALKQLTNAGIDCFFMHGNRDFLLGKQYAAECGMQIIEEESLTDLYGRPAILLHGDSLCTDDIAYMETRERVRSDEWQNRILSMPVFVRRVLAAYYRFKSKRSNTLAAENILDVANSAVEACFMRHKIKRDNIKLMIHGHTHRPKIHQHILKDQIYQRLVLGDWDKNLWFAKADRESIRLCRQSLAIDEGAETIGTVQ